MWARWNRARLQIYEHTREQVRGRVVYSPEVSEAFAYHLATRTLTLGEASEQRTLHLDEMGVEVP